MKNEDVSKLIEEFVRRVKLYEFKYGRDEFWKACLNVYIGELKDWHDSQYNTTEINKQRLTIIANVLLDAISYMSKKNIKEQFMKKSQLKALIREVIEEMDNDSLVTVWEVYERDGAGCVAYLNEKDARESDVFENGYDKISKTTIRVSPQERQNLNQRGYIYVT